MPLYRPSSWVTAHTPCSGSTPSLASHPVNTFSHPALAYLGHGASVASLINNKLNRTLVRLTVVGEHQRDILEGELGGTVLSDVPNMHVLTQCAKPLEALDTGALYRLCSSATWKPFLRCSSVRIRAPSKLHFFGWMLVQARILSRSSLLKKGMRLVAEAAYPICEHPKDNASHIILSCPFASRFWAMVCGRHPPDANAHFLHTCPSGSGCSKSEIHLPPAFICDL
jgi:hypothetical protein